MLGKSQIKYIQSLGQKKVRDEEGMFIAEGPKIIYELLASARTRIQQLYALPDWIEAHHDECREIQPVEVNETELQKVSQLTTSNKVLAVVKKFESPADILIKEKVLLVLDTIQDPGNLGTIIRICDWFGIEQIICSKECADLYNPKVVQSTMGSFLRVRLFYTNLYEWLGQQSDASIYAATLEGKDVTTMNKITEGLIVIGNESKGIKPDVMNRVNEKITIPRKGKAESLNAASAAAIILSHIV
jgi:TrmH family RNA methyltransferase